MNKPLKIANIINFVRSVEPREADDSYLLPTLENELKLCEEHGFVNTVLFQYDALIKEEYRNVFKSHSSLSEAGLWLEIVQPLVEDAGFVWRGRYVWDWSTDVNFLASYSTEERCILIDTAFQRFKEYFGYFPRVAGSWFIDAFSLNYMHEKYGIAAACICKEQYGTDGITIWGGQYNGGFYPCRNNLICPAQTKEQQIDVPVFRMLGPDPVYQYDRGLGSPCEGQSVFSLEPVYPEGGGSEAWVRWYLDDNYSDNCISHSYAQFGQENSFGWNKIGEPLAMQFRLLKEKIKTDGILLQKLSESGEMFKRTFSVTPVTAVCTEKDYYGKYKSVWYSGRYYRINLLSEDGKIKIRDFQLFDENCKEQNLTEKNTGKRCGQFNLPVADGFRFSADGIIAGIYPADYGCAETGNAVISRDGNDVCFSNSLMSIRCSEKNVEILFSDNSDYLEFRYANLPYIPYKSADKKKLYCSFGGFSDMMYDYEIKLSSGFFSFTGDKLSVIPERGKIIFDCAKE